MWIIFLVSASLLRVPSIINPRRACAERVTVVVWCVCMYVCHAHAILAVRAIKSVTKDTVVLNVRFVAFASLECH